LTPAAAPVEVAVGVVIRADGSVLLAQRPDGKPYAGWWEFPGGKLEPGEAVDAALARELHEELGLDVRASCPWVVREFVYPHAHVRLHFRRVFEFDGEPRSREGQAFAWQRPGAVAVAPLLPASVPVIEWLTLPEVCARSAGASMGPDAFVEALARRLAAGLRLLLLDEPALPAAAFQALLARVVPMCRDAGARVLVGAAHGESVGAGADGVLLDDDALARAAARPAGRLAGATCADAAGLERAFALGLDFVVLPRTAAAPMPGVPFYRAADSAAPHELAAARRAGAHGLAVGERYWRDAAPGETGA